MLAWRGESPRIKVHITHGNHVVDLLNAQPVQYVWHESLEAHILHARNQLGRAEILVC